MPERESTLLDRVVSGDRDAFDSMVFEHVNLAKFLANRYADYYCVRRFDSELVSSAVFAIVYAVDRIRRGCMKHPNYKAYITKYIHLYLQKSVAKAKKEVQYPCVDDVEKVHNLFPVRDSVKERAEVWEVLSAITEDETERQIIELRVKGFVDNEICKILDMPKTTVFRIRKKLQQRYERKVKK